MRPAALARPPIDAAPEGRVRILHLALEGDSSGYFPGLARFHDRSRYEMSFGTLRPITAELRRTMSAAGVPVLDLQARGRAAYPIAWPRLLSWLGSHRIRILHTHLFDPSVVGLTAGWAGHVPVRVLTRHHSDYHTRIDKRWHVRLDRLCTRLAHRVIAVSHETARVMTEEEKAPPAKVQVIHNGVDFSRLVPPTPSELAELRRELALEGRFVLSVVARLHPEKGQQHLLRAMPPLIEATQGAVLLLVAGSGGFRESYEDEARRLGVASSVRFLGFRPDAARIFAASDVVVLPSVAEAFGLVVVEALHLGRPVVATRVGGIPEIAEDGVSAILVPPADPGALAEAVLRLYRDPDLRQRLAEAGRRRAKDFSFETMMRRYEATYEELLGTGGRSGSASAPPW